MPAAPRILDVNLPQVTPSGAPGNDYEHIDTNADMFGGAVARGRELIAGGEEKLGQGIQRAGEDVLDAQIQRQRLDNQVHGSELHSWFSDQAGDLMTQFSQLQGRAALDQRPSYIAQLQQLQKDAENQAGSPELKALVSTNTRRTMDYISGAMTSHADRQRQQWYTTTAKNNITSAIGMGGLAIRNDDFDKLDQQMRVIDQEAHNYFDPQGYDEASLKVEVQKYRGTALKNWVETAATNDKDPDNIGHALQIFERYSPTIDPDNKLTISKWISAKAQARTVDRLSNYYLAPKGTTVRTDLSPEMRGLLDTISGGETLHGGYNELYTGKQVEALKPGFDYSDHPRIMFPAAYGPTSAFGRYQITKTTWDADRDRYGLTDITPQSQDTWAVNKATELYQGAMKQGRFAQFPNLSGNLDADLKAHANDPAFLNTVGNAVSHEWTSAPGGLQPNAQTATWALRFKNNIARNRGQTTLPDEGELLSRISTDPLLADRPELKKAILTNVSQKLSVAQRAEGLQQKAQKEQSDAAELDVFKKIHSDDPNLSLQAIFNNPHLSKDAIERMTKAYEERSGVTKADHTYGQGFYGAYQAVHLPEGDPSRITDPSQLYGRVGPTGDLTVAGVDKLINEIQARRSPEGVAESEMRNQFLKTARAQITGTDEGLHIRDPKGDDLYLRFLAQVLPAYDQGRKQGKSAASLLNPDSADYVGKGIASFKRPMEQWFSDTIHDQVPAAANPATRAAPFDPKTVTSIDQAVQLYRAGKLTKQQADDLAIANGWAVRRPPPPQVPTSH